MVSDRSGELAHDGIPAAPAPGEAPALDEALAHGGNLFDARQRFPDAPEPFLDLSTGINPHPWPFPAPPPPLPPEALTRLPEPAALRALEAAAARRYGAPSAAHVLAAPGTQALLPLVAALAPPGRARVLGPTYAEHARAAALAGHAVAEVRDLDALAGAAVATVVNPNNPDGRIVPADALRALADRVGLLVVDEAFMEAGPPGTSVAGMAGAGPNGRANILVLRSFGKFHGLAGLRLGFAIAAPALLSPLRARLGPWAVSGPAIALGTAALADDAWGAAMRARLAAEAARLDAVLVRHGLARAGGTPLFRLVRGPRALFDHLGRHGILVRRFADRPDLFRIGLPPDNDALARLDAALGSLRAGSAAPGPEDDDAMTPTRHAGRAGAPA